MNKIEETTQFLISNDFGGAETAIILGTGLNDLAGRIEVEKQIDYEAIPNFPVSTVSFHHGKLIQGRLEGRRVLAMQGRFHVYEGYSLREVAFPVWVMKKLGIKRLLISNAAGTMNPEMAKGELMLIEDHINLLGGSPLAGPNIEMGPRFPDMSSPYDPDLNKRLTAIAKENGIPLHQGVYVAVPGPNLETRAEYRFLRTIGADAVGMSTVPEVIAANHCSLPCCAVSVLTDECDPDNLKPAELEDILKTAEKAEPSLTRLYTELILSL